MSQAAAKTEKQKMLDGEFYYAFDQELLNDRRRAKQLCFELNQTSPLDDQKRQSIAQQIIGTNDAFVESPFQCDYGYNIKAGRNFYANHGCTILDCNVITLGDNVLLAPHVCLSTAAHPTDATSRANGDEYALPITIGSNVWIGANVTVCPNVTIGDNVVIGANAVVHRDIPSNSVAGGVPAKVLKRLDPPMEAPKVGSILAPR